jgi:hypothetical protein
MSIFVYIKVATVLLFHLLFQLGYLYFHMKFPIVEKQIHALPVLTDIEA